jgi:hypothetical protein
LRGGCIPWAVIGYDAGLKERRLCYLSPKKAMATETVTNRKIDAARRVLRHVGSAKPASRSLS